MTSSEDRVARCCIVWIYGLIWMFNDVYQQTTKISRIGTAAQAPYIFCPRFWGQELVEEARPHVTQVEGG